MFVKTRKIFNYCFCIDQLNFICSFSLANILKFTTGNCIKVVLLKFKYLFKNELCKHNSRLCQNFLYHFQIYNFAKFIFQFFLFLNLFTKSKTRDHLLTGLN